ncbi:MAG: sensor histidine kinase [Verrucomicrobiae bacterium]|nr:sensor histidine kinase [Verrucomicrobiae bacterium]
MKGIHIDSFLLAFYMAVSGSVAAADKPMENATPRQLFIGQPVQPDDEGRWSVVEGVVTFAGRRGDGINLELSSGAGHMEVSVAEADAALAALLLKSRVRVEGLCIGVHSGINGEVVSSLSSPSQKNIIILQVPQETWQRWPLRTVAELPGPASTNVSGQILHLGGRFGGTNADGTLELTDQTGSLKFKSSQGRPKTVGLELEILGIAGRDSSNEPVVTGVFKTTNLREKSTLPVLTTTEQVRWLKPEEAGRRYPVKVRAVVTFLIPPPDPADGNLQDGTGGIYAWNLVSADGAVAVQPGDFCEIEGDTSAGDFSPGIYCHKLKVLGRGQFPEPVRPAWTELASGSLDAQWVEIEGIVLSATNNEHLEIGTQGGRIACFVASGRNLDRLLNAIVRVRGVVVADWDKSRHVQGLHLNLPSEEFVSLEMPPPENPFAMPGKQIKALLYYDPGQTAFRREKVVGQIIGRRDGVCYLTDGTNGLRLRLEQDGQPAAGDMVEAVGFPEIDDATETPLITLREAIIRVTGHQPLPAAADLAPANLLDLQHDSTRVQLEALLIRSGMYGADQVLELQSGARTFFARLEKSSGTIPALIAGSRVRVTGVYVFNNGHANGRAETGPFELLLNSPADVRVLALPSWWTSEHAMMVVSGMGVVILLGLIWIGMLRQQVDRRTAQLSAANKSLEAEIAERKRTENELVRTRLQHLVEQERTRIARDIHDELGSTLSQIRLLSEMTLSQNESPPAIQDNNAKISSKALEATRVLDEIVWAVDPHNDTLESLASYLFSFASDYFSLAGIRFRIDAPTQIPHHVLTTQIRHQAYMAIKETLTNIVSHARASEVWIRLRLESGAASFVIEDNGRGFDVSAKAGEVPGASGLNNMRKRFEEIGGGFFVESAPEQGTRIKFNLPLAGEAKL